MYVFGMLWGLFYQQEDVRGATAQLRVSQLGENTLKGWGGGAGGGYFAE